MQPLIDFFWYKNLIPHGLLPVVEPRIALATCHLRSADHSRLVIPCPLMLVYFIRQRKDLPSMAGCLFAGLLSAAAHALAVGLSRSGYLILADGLLKALRRLSVATRADAMVIPRACLTQWPHKSANAEIHKEKQQKDAFAKAKRNSPPFSTVSKPLFTSRIATIKPVRQSVSKKTVWQRTGRHHW